MVWTITEKGKRMPVDSKPVPDGNLFVWQADDGEMHSRVEASQWPSQKRYVSHFATCQFANHHRKDRK